jgi:hypothetical protein
MPPSLLLAEPLKNGENDNDEEKEKKKRKKING